MSTLASSNRASGLRVSSAIAACINTPRHAWQHVQMRSADIQVPPAGPSHVKLGCMRPEVLTEPPGQLCCQSAPYPLSCAHTRFMKYMIPTHLELPHSFIQPAHLVQRQAAAAAQHTAGGVDPAGELKVPQGLCILLLLHLDLTQAVPAGTTNNTVQ